MKKIVITYFCVLVTGSITAILFPPAVLIGLFAGILPGLILLACPPLLFYSLLWLGVRTLLWWPVRILFGIGAFSPWQILRGAFSWAAFVIAFAVAIGVPQSINRHFERIAENLRSSDREPDRVLVLPEDIALDFPRVAEDGAISCETICFRLLYNGAVKRVFVWQQTGRQQTGSWSVYRVERREKCPNVRLAMLAVVFPDDDSDHDGEMASKRVKARIAAGECLIGEPVGPVSSVKKITLREVRRAATIFDGPWSPMLDTVAAQRLEFSDETGRIVFRRTEVTVSPLDVPLRFSAMSSFMTTVTYAGLARSEAVHSVLGPSARDVLPRWLGPAVRKPNKGIQL